MVNITLFEIHLDDATMTANAPFSGSEDGDGTDSEETSTDESDDDGGLPVAPLVGLVVLVILAVAAKKLLGGDDLEVIEVDTD